MNRRVVDTNVAVVANGNADASNGGRVPKIPCRIAAIEALTKLLESGRVLLDEDGAIQAEYRRRLSPRMQPGVGDRFYLEVLLSAPRIVERVPLPINDAGDYVDFPCDPRLAQFDPDDRKFAALGRRMGVPILNAVDSDWLNHRVALIENGVSVVHICGCNRNDWFD